MNGENLPIVCPRQLKWSPPDPPQKPFWRHSRPETNKQCPGFFCTCHFYTPLSVQCHPKYSLACMCSSKSSSYYAWQEYNVVKSNWRGMLTVDIWAQLYSLVMTSKPYFRTEKPVYLYLFLCIPSVVLSVELKKKKARKNGKTSESRWNDCATKTKRMTLDFISCQWPLSFQGSICQSGSSTEPQSHATTFIASSALLLRWIIYFLLLRI